MKKLVTLILSASILIAALPVLSNSSAFAENATTEDSNRDLSSADTRPNILLIMADDWGGGPHAGCLGDPVVKTPTFDRIAREGVLFHHAYVASPSCTPSRGAVLTGQAIHRLGMGGNLWSEFPVDLTVYPDILEAAGYSIGMTPKAWGPGISPHRKYRNPAGPSIRLEQFLSERPKDRPFCYWLGSHKPHRGYPQGSGVKSGMDPTKVSVPPYLPDTPTVRSDLCDYYLQVQLFDTQMGSQLELLEKHGLLDNTLIIMTGDNGLPFPRAKCNVYDAGSRIPFAVRWGRAAKPGRVVNDFISFTDIAPTVLEAAGIKPPANMTGRSFLNILKDNEPTSDKLIDPKRDRVFVEKERHTDCRPDHQSYPMRMVRTHKFLYIRNLRPELWPAGKAPAYRDVDNSPSKSEIVKNKDLAEMKRFYELGFSRRPAEELYDLSNDSYQINNVAADPDYAAAKTEMRAMLDQWMQETDDPRAHGETDQWDRWIYKPKKPSQAKPIY